MDWDDVALADYYLVRWGFDDPYHYLNQGVRPTTSNTTITVADYGENLVQVQACNAVGCGPSVTQRIIVDGGSFCNRTPAVRNAIMDMGPYVADCTAFTAEHLAGITGDLLLGDYSLIRVKAGDFDGLTGLGGLSLQYNKITELPEQLFDDLTSLTWLRLNDNRLTGIPVGAFSNLAKLERLHLGQNRLTALPADLIDDNSSLHTLVLANNRLPNIPAGLLEDRSSLKTLHLNGNRLTTLEAGLFEDLTNVQTLQRDAIVNPRLCDRPASERDAILGQLTDISNCELVTHADVASALDGLPSMAVCDRTAAVRDVIVNQVDEVSDCANVTDAHLSAIAGTLNLATKELSTLKLGDLDGLTGVTAVELQDNSLTTLPIGLFKDLSAATSVKLNNNQLTALSKLTFFGMDNLNSVTLTGNNLGTVPAGLFHGHTKLRDIFLDSNSLTGIRADTFDGLTALQTLGLNGNQFQRLPGGIFKDLTGISTLELDEGVNLRLCDQPRRAQREILASLPDHWTCEMVMHADLAPFTRQHIEDNHITPYQEDHPWLHEAWFDVPVGVAVRPPTFKYQGVYIPGSGIELKYPNHKGREILYHELTHHYTFDNDIHVDDPIARLSMLSSWLYFADQRARLGHPDDIGEAIAGTLWAWVVRGENADYAQQETYALLASVSAQEIPQWFFDTYATDGTLATVDLDRLWADFRRIGGFKYRLNTLFGGYCSVKEGYSAWTRDDLRNPWVEGGCVNRQPQELSATAGAAGELSVSWSAPLWNDGPAIDAYVVQWKSGDQEYEATRQELVTDLDSLSHKITGLTTGAEYTVRVAAVNQLGTADFVDNHGHARTAETNGTAG